MGVQGDNGMEETIIQTIGLSKNYREHKAIESLSMKINKGDIYGFIGKNGAGKTTFIRLLTRLINRSSGEIRFDDKKEIKIGAVIEGPACYPYLTAKENLMYYAIQQNIPNKENRVSEILSFIGLDKTKEKKFKNFSLGMKQRLGIGIAILNDPDFLILDEPINGLDPQGVVEVREMINYLRNEKGTTILISSHILSELSLSATRYGVINDGKLIKEFSKEQLEKEFNSFLYLRSSDDNEMKRILKYQGYTYEHLDEGMVVSDISRDQIDEIASLLFNKGIYLVESSYQEENLEEYYLKLISGG